MTDFITILSAPGRRLAKVIKDDLSIIPYDETAYFLQMRAPVSDINSLHQRLAGLRERRDSCVIRGSAVPRNEAAQVTFEDGQEPIHGSMYRRRLELFPDVPHHWFMVDVDGAAETDFDAWIHANLPAAFHGASYVWHLSASSGIKPGLRGHLWFWLKNPIDSLTAREWAKAWNDHLGRKALDTAIYNAVQVHYTADPVIEDEFGLLDLPRERMGLAVRESDVVDLDATPVRAAAPAGQGEVDDDWLLNQVQPLEDIDEDEARKYLNRIDNESDEGLTYDDWLKVGMALKHQFGDDGLELFLEFSQRSPKYDEADAIRRWKSFHTQRRNAATFSSIIYMAGGKIKPETEEEVKASYEDLRNEIEACNNPDALAGRMVKKISHAGLSKTHMLALLDACRKRVKTLTGALLPKSVFTAPLAEEAKKGKALTDLHLEVGITNRVIETYFPGGRIKAVGGNFWLYEKGVWRLRDDSVLRRRIFDFLSEALEHATTDDKFIEQLAESDRTDRIAALVDSIIKVLRDKVSETENDPLGLMDPVTKSIINCRNGEVWFTEDGTVEFRQHDPRNNLTQQLACDFDEEAECPTWDMAVDRVFRGVPNKDAVIAYWYELLGYIIQPTRSAGEAWMLMKGPGGNGKSFLLDIIQTIVGEASTSASMAELSRGAGDHFSATLVGKLLLVDDDFKAKGLLPDDWMKKLTGQKMLTANPKYQAQFNFLCRAMVVILSNGWPSTQDVSDGMKRRANVFEVNHILTDDERDPAHRTTIIAKELPGVLNRLIAGWSRVLQRGGKLRPPVEVLHARERWLEHGSSALRFIRECLEPTFDDGDRLLFKDVWALYRQWMLAFEDNGRRLGRHGLMEQLQATGLKVAGFDGHARSDYFHGWRIQPGAQLGLVEAAGL